MRSLSITILLTAGFLLLQTGTAPGQVAEWRLREELRIGSTSGSEAISRVTALTVSPDGSTVFVAQPLANAIYRFSATDGSATGRIGRSGEGPGEFRGVQHLGWVADSLYATDFLLSRYSLFSSTGAHYRTQQVAPIIDSVAGAGSHPIALTADGNAVVASKTLSQAIAQGKAVSTPWVLVGADGERVRTLAVRDLRGTRALAPAGEWSLIVVQPFAERSFFAIHPRGTSMVVVSQPAGRDPFRDFQVERLDGSGRMLFHRNYRYTPHRLTRQAADSILASTAAAMKGYLDPDRALEVARRYVTIPEYYPPISAIVVGNDDSIWLRRQDYGTATVDWLVLDPRGDVERSVTAPAGLTIHYVDGDTVWGVVHDALDIPYIVRYGVRQR